MKINFPKTKNVKGAIPIGTWGDNIPVYHVKNMHELNQLVGYVKLINAENGTVLYRGQCKLYPHLTPSIARQGDLIARASELEQVLKSIRSDFELKKYFQLNDSLISGWDIYENSVIEAALQHYGAMTFSVDFVDNHWTALWFGLYQYDKLEHRYIRRSNSEEDDGSENINFIPLEVPSVKPDIDSTILSEEDIKYFTESAQKGHKNCEELLTKRKEKEYNKQIKKWEQECQQIEKRNSAIDRGNKNHMFLFLYVAETLGPCIRGCYFGEHTYALDLRKALSSMFLRPGSQHGWVVRGKETSYSFDKNVACVIRLDIELANRLLGDGLLLTEENFFPDVSYDDGYKILLSRQEGSSVPTKHHKVLPEKMIPEIQK